ncbi:DinB family protein [Niallia nealsonii]|uniref:Damage-inducible protein DinB n=1 Tax=Niallia nealsonii TaxID=115979 RepID=A0A2N0Z4D2_9BACI|nr:DinB family protein [Niallia nealsonii]PKG24339.1 damage-inducible protein DinB [Niallia nealsonii]
MYRQVNDFLADWSAQAEGTIRVLEAITDEKLNQAIVEGHSTLGWLGWHLATTPTFFLGLVGLKLSIELNRNEVPQSAKEIVEGYKSVAEEVKAAVEKAFTDEMINETVESFRGPVPRGALLRTLIDHQTHHRGQMTVLLRQAGLVVPGVMGPTKEQQA